MPTRGGAADTNPNSPGQSTIASFIAAARRQIGDPYVWGAEGPDGFDCSGLVWFAMNRAGLDVPRATANGYYSSLPRVSREGLKPGDTLFFHYGRLAAGQADHMGIFIGNGKMIDASSSNDRIMLRAVDWDNFIGGGRISGLEGSSGQDIRRALKGAPRGVGGGGSLPPWADQGPDVTAGELRGTLRGFGLAPSVFDDLIDAAVQGQWTANELLAAVYDSDVFHNTFPGIFNKDGSLKMSPSEWNQIAFGDGGYADIAKEYGIKLSRSKIGMLVGGNKSPSEFAFIAQTFKKAKSSEVYRQSADQLLRRAGQPELKRSEWLDWMAGKSNARIENFYEALELNAAGDLNINAKQALKAAGQIGQPGEQVNLQELVAKVRSVKDFIAPELSAAGIYDADLAVLQSGNDPKNLQGALQQLLKNRNAIVGQQLVGASSAPGGGLFPAAREGL